MGGTGDDAYREGQRKGPPGRRGEVTLTRDRDPTRVRELKHAIVAVTGIAQAPTTKKSALKIAAAAAKRERKAKARESASASS